MPADMQIDYVELPASDFAAVERFYSRVFGWKFTSYGDGYHAFSEGRLEGGFFRAEETSRQSAGGALIVFYADDLTAAEAAVRDAGGRISTECFDFPGGRRFHFLDPHGNELAIWCRADASD